MNLRQAVDSCRFLFWGPKDGTIRKTCRVNDECSTRVLPDPIDVGASVLAEAGALLAPQSFACIRSPKPAIAKAHV